MTSVDPGMIPTPTTTEPLAPRRPGDSGTPQAMAAGALAGLVGGLVFCAVAMIKAQTTGRGVLSPLEQIAAAFYGAEAIGGGAGPVAVGLVTHELVAAVFGAIFGIFVGRRVPAVAALIFGLIYAVLIWAVVTYVILPATNRVMYDLQMEQQGWWFFCFLAYGATLALTPILAAKLGRRERRATVAMGGPRAGQY